MEIEGNRSAIEAYLRTISGRYYVYVLCRPDGRPFYVGKGINRRALEHEAEARRHHPIGEANPFKCNVIRKIIRDRGEIIYRVEAHYDASEQQVCLEREAALIKQHGRLHEGGYPLRPMTWGCWPEYDNPRLLTANLFALAVRALVRMLPCKCKIWRAGLCPALPPSGR